MSSATSALLNGLRIAAALVVFSYHVSLPWFYSGPHISAEIGHDAVTLFFVLSGYVIAYSIEGHRRRNARQYGLARLSRLYSVVGPALLLTFLLLMIGEALNPQFYHQFYRGFDGVRLVLAGCFLQEIWLLSASPPTNGVFWSLGYEFWYYVIFGIWVYGRHCSLGRWLLLGAILFVGPKVLLLFPIWIMGALAYRGGDDTVIAHQFVFLAQLQPLTVRPVNGNALEISFHPRERTFLPRRLVPQRLCFWRAGFNHFIFLRPSILRPHDATSIY